MPELIAWARTPSPALALSKGLDRDRAVDETGGQIAVFGRLGSRPFNRREMECMFLNSQHMPYRVRDTGTMQDWVRPGAYESMVPAEARGGPPGTCLANSAIDLAPHLAPHRTPHMAQAQ